MKISEKWLREWINPDVDTQTLVEQLTIAGLEVDGLQAAAGEFSGIVVAEVIDVQSHPDADKLRICQVSDGEGENKQVVCGAANVRAGMKVPFAQVGADLPGGMKIKKAKLRGVESFGMLCSEQELGMADSADGLMDLPGDADIGVAMADYLQLNDQIIELDLTPNRGDCLGILGVAREVAAINSLEFVDQGTPSVAATIDDTFPVTLLAAEDCPVYAGRVIKGINASAETPLWMQEKLRRSGLRSISPVVDITNFVLLELGQPMHAFDLNKLAGGIQVRRAAKDEALTLLDGKEIKLDDEIVVIADEGKVLAMAGVMGGADSAVSDDTNDIFLEAAYFNPLAIAGKARGYGMHTDSSHRFERGVDPALQVRAIERATRLLLDICGGSAGPVSSVTDEAAAPVRVEIPLRVERVKRLLGIDISAEQIERYLDLLQISYTGGNGEWMVQAPTYRFDLNIEADLVEEIARLYGYNNIPQTLPEVPQTMVGKPEYQLTLDGFKDVLTERGWQEAVTYSFVDPELQKQLSPMRDSVHLSNPISSEMSQMRTSHWSGLVSALQHNQNRQQKQVRLFETGLNFIATADGIDQQPWISGIAAGDFWPEQWSGEARAIDFFDIKGDLEALFSRARMLNNFSFKTEQHPALHPGQAARIYRRDEAVGWLGVLHPELEKSLSLEGPVVLFEINGNALLEANPRCFSEISKFPSIRRDLAVIVDESVTSDDILRVVNEVSVKSIVNSWVFDIYQGRGIESGRKSIALGLILLDSSRTLTDEGVEEATTKVIAHLSEKLNATLRD